MRIFSDLSVLFSKCVLLTKTSGKTLLSNCSELFGHLLPEKLFGGNGQRKEQFSKFNFQNSGHKMIGSTFLSFYDLRSAINPALLRLIRTSNSKVNFCFRRGRTAIRRSSSEEAPWRNSPVNIFEPCVSTLESNERWLKRSIWSRNWKPQKNWTEM